MVDGGGELTTACGRVSLLSVCIAGWPAAVAEPPARGREHRRSVVRAVLQEGGGRLLLVCVCVRGEGDKV